MIEWLRCRDVNVAFFVHDPNSVGYTGTGHTDGEEFKSSFYAPTVLVRLHVEEDVDVHHHHPFKALGRRRLYRWPSNLLSLYLACLYNFCLGSALPILSTHKWISLVLKCR